VSPGVNQGQFLLDMVHAEIVHAITICPGDDRVLGIGADIAAISIVDLGDAVPTDELVGFLPDRFIFSVFQLACSLDGEFFFTNLLDEGFYTIDPDTDCTGTLPNVLCTPQLVGILRTADGTTVDTHGADIEFTDDGNLYLVTNNIDPAADIRDFYEVDPDTAIATLIKNNVTPENNTGMGETIDGRLITSSVDDHLYQINPLNGNATLEGIRIRSGSIDGAAFLAHRPDPGATDDGHGTVTVHGELRAGQVLELVYRGPWASESEVSPNPFLDYRLEVDVVHKNGTTMTIPASSMPMGSEATTE